MVYVIVEFKDEIHIVPDSWVFDEARLCLWPEGVKKSKVEELVRAKSLPEKKWTFYLVSRVLYKTNDYTKALKKLEKSLEINSDSEKESTGIESMSGSDFDEHPRKKLCMPTPPGKISKNSNRHKKESQNLTTNLIKSHTENESRHSLSDITNIENEKDFQWKVIYKLNEILSNQKAIEQRLTALENSLSGTNIDANADKINDLFPLKSVDDIEKFELFLKDKSNLENVVNVLRCIGGGDEDDVLLKIMKKLLPYDVAEQFNFCGKSKKRPFKELTLLQVILKSVRFHYPSITEAKVFNGVAKFLKYAKQRRERQALKSSISGQNQEITEIGEKLPCVKQEK